MKKPMRSQDWKLVAESNVADYGCGLRAGDLVRLRKDLIIKDIHQRPTGIIYQAGEVWLVLHGFAEEPGVLWLRQHDGRLHTWDDDQSVWEYFEKVTESEDTAIVRKQIEANTKKYYEDALRRHP